MLKSWLFWIRLLVSCSLALLSSSSCRRSPLVCHGPRPELGRVRPLSCPEMIRLSPKTIADFGLLHRQDNGEDEGEGRGEEGVGGGSPRFDKRSFRSSFHPTWCEGDRKGNNVGCRHKSPFLPSRLKDITTIHDTEATECQQ